MRWTERRNLACFIDLIARGELDLNSLVSGTFPVEEAVQVYDRLSSGELHGVGSCSSTPTMPTCKSTSPLHCRRFSERECDIVGSRIARRPGATLGVGFIGAGNYASSMLLPHLLEKPSVKLQSRCDQQVSELARRKEAVRIRRGEHRRRSRPRRRNSRCGLRRDEAPLARRADLSEH